MGLHWRKAITLAIRNFCITLAGTLGAMPLAHSISDFRTIGVDWLFALYAAAVSAAIAFLLNLVEDNSRLDLGTKAFTTSDATRKV
ncbi:MAG: hypothetical protein ACRDQZ_09770 [Mycobacteriales bacterium]